MRRRDFLKALPVLPAIAAVPRLTGGVKIKVTDIRLIRTRVIKELGTYVGFMGPWDVFKARIGGGSVIEVHTDQGLVGLGPAVDPVQLPNLKNQLIGQDPFDIQTIVANLREVAGMGTFRRLAPAVAPPPGAPMTLPEAAGRGGDLSAARAYSAVEVALWDIIGKACNQPLYKLWGPAKERVAPYASQSRLSTPEERADLAAQLKAQGWRAIKYRCHFQTMKDDIRLVEATRKAVGDDWDIMCDANQATNGFLTPTVTWDFRRAVQTARAYNQLNVYWLEEPLRRYDYEQLAELNRMFEMPIAGGEGNRGLHEFKALLDKGCFDVVQPEILLEGPLEMRKIQVLAESLNKVIVPHLGDGTVGTVCNMHLVASWPNSPYIEVHHDVPQIEYTTSFAIFEEPPVLDKSGYFNMTDKPGLGISINKDLILPS